MICSRSYRVLEYRYKRAPFKHQKNALRISARKKNFALFAEMGTGKTKILIDNAAMLFQAEEIDACVIIAPNGLQQNWLDEIKLNFPNDYFAAYWSKLLRHGGTGKPLKEWPVGRAFRFFILNIEALLTDDAYRETLRFIKQRKVLLAVDESTRIKSPDADRTRRVMMLGQYAKYKRIMSGAPMPNGPIDIFSQMKFLDPQILGFDSFVAFKSYYCMLVPPTHPLVQNIAKKSAAARMRGKSEEQIDALAKKFAGRLQIMERGTDGQPLYRNLEVLEEKIAPHLYRIRKADCLDLPPKVYQKVFVELSPKQQKIYDQVRNEIMAEFVIDKQLHQITSEIAIKRMTRLAQIICNHFVPDPDYDEDVKPQPQQIDKISPRITALEELIEDAGRPPLVIWVRHRYDIVEISELLKRMKIKHGILQGKLSIKERTATIAAFQAGKIGAIIGIAALGIGINLQRADLNIYYSNSFNLEDRLQSEDRSHRAGRQGVVNVIDIIAASTLDEKIVTALRSKKNIAHAVLRDRIDDWI